MKYVPTLLANVTLLFWIVLFFSTRGTANLRNYGHDAKGKDFQVVFPADGLQDTIPAGEPENFDPPFGSKPDYKPHTPDPFARQESTPSKIIQAVKVEIDKPKPKLYKVPTSYKGFKIEIKNTPKPLSASNDIFFQHGKLFAEKLKDGSISYLLGDFADAGAADTFMTDFLIRRYPEAKVIEYDKGNRLN